MRILFAVLIALLAVAVGEANAMERVLTYSDHEPLGNMRTAFLNDVFFKNIEKESHGKLKIEPHWNSELSTGYDALKKTKDGTLDMAVIVPEYDAANMPLHQLFKSFPLGPSGKKQVEFLSTIYRDIPVLQEELEKQNLVPVYVAIGYPVAFYSTSPIKDLTDLKNKKLRTASFWHQDHLKAVGASPVKIPWGKQVYDALKKKELDGLMVNIDSGYDINAQEVAPYILTSKKLWLGHIYVISMNKDVWGSLSKDDKAAIKNAADASYKSMGSFADKAFEWQIKELKKSNAKVRILTDKELLQWKQAVNFKEIQNQWIDALPDKTIVEDVRNSIQARLNFYDTNFGEAD